MFKMRKKRNLDKKKQWSWAEETHPDDINDTYVNKSFLLSLTRCKPLSNHRRCNNNPFCLSGLGEQRWLQNKVIPIGVPELDRRQTNTFCGLKNLGATCYINSLLQLWFHNLNIRNAILNWNPEEDEIEKNNHTLYIENAYEPVTGIGQLQLVFALMQFGKEQTVNPERFIKSLKIDTDIEQDAEEFSNLLLTTLESKFEKQANVFVKNMVKHNFLGEYQSVITCLTCKLKSSSCSTFRDLSLNIEGQKTLKDSLEDYLKEEVLAGDDQYYCSQCKGKQNAVRQMCLTALPSVLNFQLMRFVYDRQSMQKKKLNTFIRFPQTLDMRQYLYLPDKPNVSSRENYNYNLYAVLIHEGPSANCGHYVAQIKDNTTKQWYQFNDDKVNKLILKGLNLCTDDDFKRLKSMKNVKNYVDEYQSNNAYMLVYMNDMKTEELNIKSTTCELSPRLTQLVNFHNNNFENKILESKQGQVFVEQMLQLINEMKHSQIKENEGDIISLQWLKYWLKINPNETVEKINNNPLLCKHNLLDPDKVFEAKYIGSDFADKLYGTYEGGPRLKLKSSLCQVCIRNQCALMYNKTLAAKHGESINAILQNWSPTNSSHSENEETYWVGNETIKIWQTKYFEAFQTFLKKNDVLPNTTFPINHETLSAVCEPSSILEDKNINLIKDTENMIKSDYDCGKWEDNLLQSKSLEEIYQNNGYDCLQFINNTERVQWVYNSDIMCIHGNMAIEANKKTLVPEKVKNMFQTYFPKASLFAKSGIQCKNCKSVHFRIMVCKLQRSNLAQIEDFILNDLLWNKDRHLFLKECFPRACISKEFLEALRKFVEHPLKEPVPELIRNKVLLCDDHNKLLYRPMLSLNPTHDDDNKLVLVTKKEWTRFLMCCDADFGVFVNFDDQLVFISSNPEICETCSEKKMHENEINYLKYNDVKIFIQVINTDDKNLMSGNCPKKFKRDTTVSMNGTSGLDTASTSKNTNNHASQSEVRRSERKQMPKVKSVIVSSDSSLLHLKLKIMEVFHVKPNNQCLKTSDGIELLNDEATMENLKILPDSVILAQFDEHVIHKPEVVIAKETGFKGTELMNYNV